MQLNKLLVLLACLLVLVLLPSRWAWLWWHEAPASPVSLTFTVSPGDTTAAVARALHTQGLLTRPRLWQAVTRFKGLDNHIKQGEYRIESSLSPQALLALLVAGRVVEYQVTLPEGINLDQAIGILHAADGLQATLSGARDPALLSLVAPYGAAEGWFFPDSYRYVRGDSDLDVLRTAQQRMQGLAQAAWESRDDNLPYDDLYQALIMASIVERETGMAAERSRIAGVFVRRLQQRMRLQTDPAVIYGLGPEFDGNLRRRHLNDDTNPFNTYRHFGLPPTPIALPGAAALEAALHPAPGTELFFVARGDGSHQFSDTLEQHNQAVQAYQIRRVDNYRSRPDTGNP